MKDPTLKWYYGTFFVNISVGIMLFLFLTGIGGCFNLLKFPLPKANITINNPLPPDQESTDGLPRY